MLKVLSIASARSVRVLDFIVVWKTCWWMILYIYHLRILVTLIAIIRTKINDSASVPRARAGIGCLDKTYGETNNYIPVPPANDSNLYEPTFVDTSYIDVISDIPSENEYEIIEIQIIENNSNLKSSLNESNFIDSNITINIRERIDGTNPYNILRRLRLKKSRQNNYRTSEY